MPINDLRSRCTGFRCLMALIKAKIVRNKDCISYNWIVKRKPGIMLNLSRFHGKLRDAIEKIEQSIKIKELDAKEKAEQYKSKMSAEKIKGWWSEDEIAEKKRKILGIDSENLTGESARRYEQDDAMKEKNDES